LIKISNRDDDEVFVCKGAWKEPVGRRIGEKDGIGFGYVVKWIRFETFAGLGSDPLEVGWILLSSQISAKSIKQN
jgi:hypothetical protein